MTVSCPFPYRTIHFIALIVFIYKTQQHSVISLASVNAKEKKKNVVKQIQFFVRSWNHSGHVLTAALKIEEND